MCFEFCLVITETTGTDLGLLNYLNMLGIKFMIFFVTEPESYVYLRKLDNNNKKTQKAFVAFVFFTCDIISEDVFFICLCFIFSYVFVTWALRATVFFSPPRFKNWGRFSGLLFLLNKFHCINNKINIFIYI